MDIQNDRCFIQTQLYVDQWRLSDRRELQHNQFRGVYECSVWTAELFDQCALSRLKKSTAIFTLNFQTPQLLIQSLEPSDGSFVAKRVNLAVVFNKLK